MNDRLTVDVAARQFLDWLKLHRKPNTHKWYSEHLSNFLGYVKGSAIDELRAYHLRDFLSLQTWSPSYKAGLVASVKRWASWMVERELLTANPFQGVKSPGIKARDNVPTPDEIESILRRAKGPTHQILTVLVESGARPFELREARVSWKTGDKLVVPIQIAKKGKPRAILLNDRCSSIIDGLIEGRSSEDFIFLNHLGKPWSQNGLLQAIRRCCDGRKFSPYDLRHAFATNALEQGVDSLLVGHLMGHSDVTMIAKDYAKPREDKLREVLEKLGRRTNRVTEDD